MTFAQYQKIANRSVFYRPYSFQSLSIFPYGELEERKRKDENRKEEKKEEKDKERERRNFQKALHEKEKRAKETAEEKAARIKKRRDAAIKHKEEDYNQQ